MSQRINKHRVATDGPCSIRHGRYSSVSHFGIMGGNCFIWLVEEDEARTIRRTYMVVRTAEQIPPGFTYLRSATDPATGHAAHLLIEG